MTEQTRPAFMSRQLPQVPTDPDTLRQQAIGERQAGHYTLSTLRLYKRCWIESGQSSDWLAYLWFRRALGYPLTPNRVVALQQLAKQNLWQRWRSGLSGRNWWQLQSLLDEYHTFSSDIPPTNRETGFASLSLTTNTAPLQQWRSQQLQWQQQLAAELRNCRQIALVGNGRQLHGSRAGDWIDQADFVVRFNHCFSASSHPMDTGRKIQLWVMAPNYAGEIPDADWILMSGPNSLWLKKSWPALSGRRVLAVPLSIWRSLVRQLGAPPSSGVLAYAYLQTLLQHGQQLLCFGVGYTTISSLYHQADAAYQPSVRHHWSAELAWWKCQPIELAQPVVAVSESILSPKCTKLLQQQGWYTSELQTGQINLLRTTAIPAGWWQLTCEGDPQIIAVSLQLQQQPVPLQLLKIDGGYQLIFRRYQQLDRLLLQLTSADPAASLTLTKIELRPLPAWLAFSKIFRYVWQHASDRGEANSRILHLSIARFKRAGWPVVQEKLLKTYQPQLAQQWSQLEPYQYWLQQIEPALQAVSQSAGQTEFQLVLRADALGKWRHSVQSVLQQRYPHWQLYIVSSPDAPNATDITFDANTYTDPRLHFAEPAAVLDKTYIWQLYSGDLLSADALLQLHNHIQNTAEPALLYSDHDQLQADGSRHSPAFKPDWAPDYFLQFNYIGAAFCYQARLKPADADWWQLGPWLQLLKMLPQIAVDERSMQIQHLSLVLYHQHQGVVRDQLAASQAMVQRPFARIQQQITELVQHDEHCLPTISTRTPGLFRVSYPLPQPLPLVTLIIPTRDALLLTRTCVDSILARTTYQAFEILLLDNQSSERETLDWFAEISQHPKVRVLRYDAPFNYSAINNFGVAHSEAPLIGLVNNDTEVMNPDWLGNMVQHALRPMVGCVGAKLHFSDQTIQHAGVILGLWGLAGHSHKFYPRSANGEQFRLQTVQNYSAVTAACLVMRRELFVAVGGLNEQHLTVAFNDVDLCLKVQQAGYRNLWTPDAELFHYESKSRGKEDTPQKKAREQQEIQYMRSTWPAQIAHDPYYNRHLTRQREDFSIAVAETSKH